MRPLLTEELLIQLGQAGLRQLTLSFDSIADEYESLRGVPFATALERLRMILAHKAELGYRVIVSTVAVNEKYGLDEYRRNLPCPASMPSTANRSTARAPMRSRGQDAIARGIRRRSIPTAMYRSVPLIRARC